MASGRKLNLNHPGDAIAAGLVLVPANRLQALLPQRSIRENVALPLGARSVELGSDSCRDERLRVAAAVKRLQIDARAGSELRRLSGGNQQKVVIARWVAAGFQTLLCFDPTRGIDMGTKHQIYRLAARNGGRGVVRAAVHLRASGNRLGLRPGDRLVRRRDRRRDAGRRGR